MTGPEDTAAPARIDDPPAREGKRSGAAVRRRGRGLTIAQGLLGMVIVAALLEMLVRTGVLPSPFVPPPSAILAELAVLVTTPPFWAAVGETMGAWAFGLLLAVVIAVPLGLAIGSNVYVYRGLRPIVEFLRPIPSVALIPLAILIFGTGFSSKTFLIVFAASWPILINTIYGIQDRDPVQRETARAFRIPPMTRVLRVVLPSALPFIATGVRISSSVALILAVTAELVIGSPGLGRDIAIAQASGAYTAMYALIVTAGLLGVAINVVVRVVERRLLQWHPSQRGAS